jgi:hypothetical protein
MTHSGFNTAQSRRNNSKKDSTSTRRKNILESIRYDEECIIEPMFVRDRRYRFARPKHDNKVFYEPKY